jgi:hypothetical protein
MILTGEYKLAVAFIQELKSYFTIKQGAVRIARFYSLNSASRRPTTLTFWACIRCGGVVLLSIAVSFRRRLHAHGNRGSRRYSVRLLLLDRGCPRSESNFSPRFCIRCVMSCANSRRQSGRPHFHRHSIV